jgi:hypothetical protein
MNFIIEKEIAELQAKQRYGMDEYKDWRALADMIIAQIDIAEGRYGKRSEDCGAGWGS